MSIPITVRDANLLAEIKGLPNDAAHQVIAKAFLESTVALSNEVTEARRKISALESQLSRIKVALQAHQGAIKDIVELTK